MTNRVATMIEDLARREGKTPEEIRASMQEAIDAAWENPASRAYQNQLFPAGKPTVEEFVAILAGEI